MVRIPSCGNFTSKSGNTAVFVGWWQSELPPVSNKPKFYICIKIHHFGICLSSDIQICTVVSKTSYILIQLSLKSEHILWLQPSELKHPIQFYHLLGMRYKHGKLGTIKDCYFPEIIYKDTWHGLQNILLTYPSMEPEKRPTVIEASAFLEGSKGYRHKNQMSGCQF